MESIKNFYDVENPREYDEKIEDIENSIHNSLLYNRPTTQYNCYELVLKDCLSLLPFGIMIVIIIICMIMTVIIVKKLF